MPDDAPSASPGSTAVLACDVFREELETFAGEEPPWSDIRYLEMGLHDRPDALRREVQRNIGELDARLGSGGTILLAYALCGNGLLGVRAGTSRLVLPRAHDCISVLLGDGRRHRGLLHEEPGTYFYSPGWIRGGRVPGPDRPAWVRAFYRERFDDPERVEELVEADAETFEHYKRAAYVDITGNAAARRYCEGCARHLGWEFRRLEGDPDFFRSLLRGPWEAARFLIVEPGGEIAPAGDARVVEERRPV